MAAGILPKIAVKRHGDRHVTYSSEQELDDVEADDKVDPLLTGSVVRVDVDLARGHAGLRPREPLRVVTPLPAVAMLPCHRRHTSRAHRPR